MREILYKYRERLINLSGRNRSLVSMTLPKKRAFDLIRLEDIKSGISREVAPWILDRDSEKLMLIDDAYKLVNDKKEILKKKLANDKQWELRENLMNMELLLIQLTFQE